jgi:hypothetical protein
MHLLEEVEASSSLNLTAVPESPFPDTGQRVYRLAEPEIWLANMKTETRVLAPKTGVTIDFGDVVSEDVHGADVVLGLVVGRRWRRLGKIPVANRGDYQPEDQFRHLCLLC